MSDDFVGMADLIDRWGYTRQGLHKLVKLPDFPAPFAVVNKGRTKVWRVSDLAPFEHDHPEVRGEYWKRRKALGYYRAKTKG